MLTFFTNPMSRGRIVRWMLEEVGAPYETVVTQWGRGSTRTARRQPLGKVPTIVHDGAAVSETAAICAYLAEAFPDAGLAPRADARGAYYRLLFFTAGPIEAAMMDSHLGVTLPPEKEAMIGYGNLARAVDVLEGAVSAHDYIAGRASPPPTSTSVARSTSSRSSACWRSARRLRATSIGCAIVPPGSARARSTTHSSRRRSSKRGTSARDAREDRVSLVHARARPAGNLVQGALTAQAQTARAINRAHQGARGGRIVGHYACR